MIFADLGFITGGKAAQDQRKRKSGRQKKRRSLLGKRPFFAFLGEKPISDLSHPLGMLF
jgi:hypothetical protein